MNTKTTKFLAVLAVLAMAFAAVAVVSAEQYDATGGDVIGDYTTTADVSIPKGDMSAAVTATVMAQSTMEVTDDYKFTGYALNKKMASKGYNEALYNAYAVVYITLDLSTATSGMNGVYVGFEQTNSALKGVTAGMNHQYKASAASTTMISYFAGDTFGSSAEYFAVLIPLDGSSVGVKITVWKGATLTTGVGTATISGTQLTTKSFTMDFSGATIVENLASTAIGTIGAATNGSTAGSWYYTGSSDNKLYLNAFTGNVAFIGTIKEVDLIGANALEVNLNDNSSGITANENTIVSPYLNAAVSSNEELTIQANGIEDASLTVVQNGTGFGIGDNTGSNTVTIGKITNGTTTIISTGGDRAIFANKGLGIANAAITATGSERAIHSYGGTIALTNSVVVAGLVGDYVNGAGTDDLFGVKTVGLTLDTDSVLITDGLRVSGTTFTNNGTVIVAEDYEQNPNAVNPIDAKKLKIEIAGLYLDTYAATAIEAKKISSVLSADEPGLYFLDDIGYYVGATTITVTDESGDGEYQANPTNAADVTTAITGAAGKDVILNVTGNLTDINATTGEGQTIEFRTSGTGAVSGTFNLVDTTTKVTLTSVKGEFTLSKGSIVIDGTVAEGTITIDTSGQTVKVRGAVATEGDVIITVTEQNATVILEDGLEIGNATTAHDLILTGPTGDKKLTAQVLSDNTVNVLGTSSIVLTGNATTPNNTNFNIMGNLLGQNATINAGVKTNVFIQSGAVVNLNLAGEGNFYADDAMEEKTIGGNITSDIKYVATQRVTVSSNVVIMDGTTVSIAGELIIPEGLKITVNDGGCLIVNGVKAKADIDGSLVIEGASGFSFSGEKITVDGNVNVKSNSTTPAFTVSSGDFEVNNEVNVGTTAVAVFVDGVTINEGGKLSIKGTVEGKVTANYGIVAVDGNVGSGLTVNQQAGGIVEVLSVNGTLTVTDLGLIFNKDYKVDGTTWKENKISLTDVKGVTISSAIKIDSSTEVVKDRYTNQMFIAGALSPIKGSIFYDTEIVSGTITVKSGTELDMGKVGMTVGGKLSVAGTVYATSEEFGDFDGTGTVSVTGLLKTRHDDGFTSTVVINAVMYTAKENDIDYDFYTTLAKALEADAKEIAVFGSLTISKDTTIPAGTELNASSSKVTVKNPAVLTLANGCDVSAKEIVVNGTMVVENKENLSCNTILSDTSSIGETSAMYTNLAKALADAESGDVIKITKKISGEATEAIVYLRTSAVIKDGVTLEIPASKAIAITIGCTLTVDGKLYVNQGSLYANANTDASKTDLDNITGKFGTLAFNTATGAAQAAVIAVNGVIESTYDLPYGTVDASGVSDAYGIAGAYFGQKAKYYITTVQKSSPGILGADDYTVRLYGDLTIGEVAFVGTEEKNVVVEIYGDITATLMTVDFGKILFKSSDKYVSGTFGTAEGAFTFVAAYTAAASEIGDVEFTALDKSIEYRAYIEGSFDHPTAEKRADLVKTPFSLTISGDALIKNALTVNGTAVAKYHSVIIGSDADLVIAKKGTTTGSLAVMNATTYIYGGMNLMDAGSFTATGLDVYVYGALTTLDLATTEKAVAGMFTAANLFVNGSLYTEVTANGAVISGLSQRTITGLYVFPGATISGALKDAMEATGAVYNNFYVENTLWVTVYKLGNTNINIATYNADGSYWNISPYVKERAFDYWSYVSGGYVVNMKLTDTQAQIGTYVIGIGSNADISAVIDYEVYTVVVMADPGIDAMYIDDYLMPYVHDEVLGEIYKINVAAGSHVLDFKLANGYSGTPTMTVNGEKVLGGYGFKVSGDYATEDVDYKIYFQGIEKSGYVPDSPDTPEPQSEWTITTILLLILVILIAIMAVIVAIRLNRS